MRDDAAIYAGSGRVGVELDSVIKIGIARSWQSWPPFLYQTSPRSQWIMASAKLNRIAAPNRRAPYQAPLVVSESTVEDTRFNRLGDDNAHPLDEAIRINPNNPARIS
jgi:hypothetical protein